MQNSDDNSGMLGDETKAEACGNSFQLNWNKLHMKVSSVGKQTKRCLDTFCKTYFQRNVIQDAVDYLNSNPSVDYAIKTTLKFIAIFIICGVAIELFHNLRPIYWMVMNFFISALSLVAGTVFAIIGFLCSCLYAVLNFLLIFAIRLTSLIFALFYTFFIILWTILKILVYSLSGVVFLFLLTVWALSERERLSKLTINATKQKSRAGTGLPKTLISNESPLDSHTKGVDCNRAWPYCWQFKEADSYLWINFGSSDNVAIEMLYCDVENLRVNLVFKDTCYHSKSINVASMITADFEQMSMQLDPFTQFSLRRLSTPSYIQEPGNVLSTKWVWYWEDNDGWKKYAKTQQSSGTKQEDIEAAYLKKDREHVFNIGTSNYKIKFNKTSMYQRNMDRRYLTKRRVRRRPLFVSESVLQTTQRLGFMEFIISLSYYERVFDLVGRILLHGQLNFF